MNMINAGELDRRVQILSVTESDAGFVWTTAVSAWAKMERTRGRVIYSTLGVAGEGWSFTLRRRDISKRNALMWRGEHYCISDIIEAGRGFYVVTAAKVTPETCVYKVETVKKDEYNRPILTETREVIFPGIHTEKYLGYDRIGDLFAKEKDVSILVTPKEIEMEPGTLVYCGGKPYTVHAAHLLADHQNEYEIAREGDV